MFDSLWRRFNQWRSIARSDARRPQRRQRTILRLEALEERLTPAYNFIVTYGTGIQGVETLTLTEKALGTNPAGSSGNLTIINAGTVFGQFDFDPGFNTLVEGSTNNYPNTLSPITKIVLVLGGENDNIFLNGTGQNGGNGPIKLGGGLTINGSGGTKNITLNQVYLQGSAAALNMALSGSGTNVTTFTDVNVGGPAVITHGTGTTQFTINTSGNNTLALNNWNSLSITNGAGSDTNIIQDTDFAGTVNINNGSGDGTTSQFGGSRNLFEANNNKGLLTVTGGLTIATVSGQSDTQVDDYNVHGTLSINTGAGFNGQPTPNFVGISNFQTNSGTVMEIHAISITGTSIVGVPFGLLIDLGTAAGDGANGDFPLVIDAGLTISTSGNLGKPNGPVHITLNDLFVTGTTTIGLASTTSNDFLDILGDQTLSTYGPLTVNGTAGGVNTYDLQVPTGTVYVAGAANFNLGKGADTVNVGSAHGLVTITGNLGVTGTGGTKFITVTGAASAAVVQSATLGGVAIALSGTGFETTNFLDTNVTGPASVGDSGAATTQVTIDTSAQNPNLLNTWNSLTITNGVGSDTNLIEDTDFSGNVTINNGAGTAGNTNQFGGSSTLIHQHRYKVALLNIDGNLSISTTNGQSDTEVYDYNVLGTVTLASGLGIAKQINPSFVGFENKQTSAFVPVIGGAVTLTGTAVASVTPGVIIDVGTDSRGGGGDFPVIMENNLTINVGGTGSGQVILADVSAEEGVTNINFTSATTTNNQLNVFDNNGGGVGGQSTYNTFNVTTSATGPNVYDFQDQQGVLDIAGNFTFTASGGGLQDVNFGADKNTSPASGAIIELFGLNTPTTPANRFNGDNKGNDILYISASSTFDFFNPVLKGFGFIGTL